MIASFEFELETYWVNGYAAHAKASVAPRRRPPKRSPSRPSPMTASTSQMSDVRCTAGSPDQVLEPPFVAEIPEVRGVRVGPFAGGLREPVLVDPPRPVAGDAEIT